MNKDHYLARINYNGPIEPSLETLRGLHYAHLLSVPFENLDIRGKKPIVLDFGSLYAKIVERRRGGFCYELNGMFGRLLDEIGFDVSMLSAGVARPDGGFGPLFDHMALLIKMDRDWLVDVGFGSSFLFPVLFDDLVRTEDRTGAYRIINGAGDLTLARASDDGSWEPLYRFTMQPHTLSDFDTMCVYHQTSPHSSFTQRRLCTRATANGRITLSDMKLISEEGGLRQEQIIEDEEEYLDLLKQHFDVVI